MIVRDDFKEFQTVGNMDGTLIFNGRGSQGDLVSHNDTGYFGAWFIPCRAATKRIASSKALDLTR